MHFGLVEVMRSRHNFAKLADLTPCPTSRTSDVGDVDSPRGRGLDCSFSSSSDEPVSRKPVNKVVSGCQQVLGSSVKRPVVLAMCGLPARGKTYMSTKLARYLNWIGVKTRMFNVGQYRRLVTSTHNEGFDHNFFRQDNAEGKKIREEAAKRALGDMRLYLQNEGQVAIFDATNTTRQRRKMIVDYCHKPDNNFDIMFIESICDDPRVIETNIKEVKFASPDYKDSSHPENVLEDFLHRIEHYLNVYEPIDEKLEDDVSFLKIFNVGTKYIANHVSSQLQSRVCYFLMNCALVPHTIYLCRHGETDFNKSGKIGGDGTLSENGLKFAGELAHCFEEELQLPDLCVWTSVLKRTRQTASFFKQADTEAWKALNEIDAGVCDGLSYEEIEERLPEEFARRDEDKYHYRYPQGESYSDLVARVEPVIMELERRHNVLVIAHQAVARCLLAYFLNKSADELPYIEVPLHTVYKMTMRGYGCDVEEFVPGSGNIPAVNTHRSRPKNVYKSRSKEEALSTVPLHE